MNKRVKSKLEFVDCPLGEQQENTDMDPYTTFVYGIRSPCSKDSYCRRLRAFFDAINLGKDNTLGNAATFLFLKEEPIQTGHLIISLDSCIIKKKELERRKLQQAHCTTMLRP
ncbi:MAG: hypothetical protein ACM3X1_03795 [Ignavibacteriales bacterium]